MMRMARASLRLILEYWTPLVLWICTIYVFSTDTFSSAETSRIIGPILLFLFPRLSPGELEFWHGVIRKMGHVTEYFILGILAYRSLRFGEPDAVRGKWLAGIFIIAAASLDELHQLTTISRGASLVDVGYDCSGGLFALWFFTLLESRRDLRSRLGFGLGELL